MSNKANNAKPSPEFVKNAAEFVQLANSSSANAAEAKRLRVQLAALAKALFPKPLTVADAAAAVGIDLSTKGASPERKAEAQRLRTCIGRALRDEKLLLTNGNTGGAAHAPKAGQKSKADNESATVTTEAIKPFEAIRQLLPKLSRSELAEVIAQATALKASKTRVSKPGKSKPANVVQQAEQLVAAV